MTIVDLAVYKDGRRETDVPLHEAFEACRRDDAVVWIGLHEPTREEFASVVAEFGLHELAVEDAIKGAQRPKLEVYDDTLFVVIKTARYVEPDDIDFGELFLFIGDGFVVTVRHGEGSPLTGVRRALESKPELLRCGQSAILHAILDRVVDDYMPVLQSLDEDITEVEGLAFGEDNMREATPRIYKLKRETIEFHRALSPLVEPLGKLADGRFPLVHDDVRAYFRDIYDHVLREIQQVDQFRELLTSILEANLTQVSVRQNEEMRRISAVAALIAVPTMIAGIYGMNFQHMPELDWRFGYPLSLLVMIGIVGALYAYFKRIDWL